MKSLIATLAWLTRRGPTKTQLDITLHYWFFHQHILYEYRISRLVLITHITARHNHSALRLAINNPTTTKAQQCRQYANSPSATSKQHLTAVTNLIFTHNSRESFADITKQQHIILCILWSWVSRAFHFCLLILDIKCRRRKVVDLRHTQLRYICLLFVFAPKNILIITIVIAGVYSITRMPHSTLHLHLRSIDNTRRPRERLCGK